MNEIRGEAQSIRALLGGAKYAIDYYQREYLWETKQITELIEDLAGKFLESHSLDNERGDVEQYNHYFLGSIIISDKDGHKFIIDGQQRLTSLTLLLIYLYRNIADEEQKGQIADLIFSQKYGKRSFNINVDERALCMDALFTGKPFDENNQSESVINILNRYQDIKENFPQECGGESLAYFADWLIENVHLVEITAYTDSDAYTIFETMNDRGLSLTPTDMLKGYLLANIVDQKQRIDSSNIWRMRISALQELGKEEDADAIKTWLRSQYADSIRERKRGAKPKDFDLIGTEFHRWVRDHEEKLGLENSDGFAQFIREDYNFYTLWYERIRQAAKELNELLPAIHFNAQNNFTLQYPVLLAPVKRNDSEDVIYRKLRIVSRFIDILITRRVWNWHAIGYSSMQYAMFLVMRDIRGLSPEPLAEKLKARLDGENETFVANDNFKLHGMNGSHIHRLLARMIDYIERKSGRPSRYAEYIKRGGKDGYEIEHVWADHPERHTDDFEHPHDFYEYRNLIGGLLLLPKSFNASYSDLPYEQKLPHYRKHNLLAQSLHPDAYDRDPGFKRFVESSGLDFQPHPEFKKSDLDVRQKLYQALAEQIWDPEILLKELE